MKEEIKPEEIDLINSLVAEGLISKTTAKKIKTAQKATRSFTQSEKSAIIIIISSCFCALFRAAYYALWDGFWSELSFGFAFLSGAVAIGALVQIMWAALNDF